MLSVWAGPGCGRQADEVEVPAGCRKFLDEWFAALRARDAGKIEELSARLPAAQAAALPEQGLALMRETKRRYAAEGLQRMFALTGDFRSYAVVGLRETAVTAADGPAAQALGIGAHTEIVCRARCAKKEAVQFSFHLLRETPESEYCVLAWNFRVDL